MAHQNRVELKWRLNSRPPRVWSEMARHVKARFSASYRINTPEFHPYNTSPYWMYGFHTPLQREFEELEVMDSQSKGRGFDSHYLITGTFVCNPEEVAFFRLLRLSNET